MEQFEKLGELYLGRRYDLEARSRKDDLLLYDSRDLTTHAVVIGMTGSGKTGLGIILLEEGGIDGVPAIAIDPKGDLGNLLLTFPSYTPETFLPWIDKEEAARANMTAEALAADQAERWRKGLTEWGQDGARAERLRQAVDMAVFTPGSVGGRPLSIMSSFAPPTGPTLEDRDAFSERVSATVSSVLGLAGIDADPLRSREHVLLSAILDAGWRSGETLALDTLIRRIQEPPIKRLGALDVDTMYPAKDRFELALLLNNLLAAPGAARWIEGEPLDVASLLHGPSGKPRLSVISIAHLNDSERMFFVSLLLQQIIGWMRAQSGTSSLRALLYMDEVAGYMPPVANPPAKAALLTLFKQARAFGLGVIVATQNPVDLDYKALSNAGTWFLGRLQAERDKARVLDGLESVGQTSATLSRDALDKTLSGLGKRIFLMHNVHESGPVVFETRWTLSYLKGPLSRDQIRHLAEPSAGTEPAVPSHAAPPIAKSAASESGGAAASATKAPATPAVEGASAPPVLPPDVPQHVVPTASVADATYHPCVYVAGQVRFADPKLKLDLVRDVRQIAPLQDGLVTVRWDGAETTEVQPDELESMPGSARSFAPLPSAATKAKTYEAIRKEFARRLAAGETLALFRSVEHGLSSQPGESERDFRVRLQVAGREHRDSAKERLEKRYAPKLSKATEKLRRAQEAETRESEQASQQKVQTALSVGATILGAVFGRKTLSASTVTRASSAARSMGRSMQQSGDVARASARVEEAKREMEELERQFQEELHSLEARVDPLTVPLETVTLKPKARDILVQHALLVWKNE